MNLVNLQQTAKQICDIDCIIIKSMLVGNLLSLFQWKIILINTWDIGGNNPKAECNMYIPVRNKW